MIVFDLAKLPKDWTEAQPARVAIEIGDVSAIREGARRGRAGRQRVLLIELHNGGPHLVADDGTALDRIVEAMGKLDERGH